MLALVPGPGRGQAQLLPRRITTWRRALGTRLCGCGMLELSHASRRSCVTLLATYALHARYRGLPCLRHA